MNGAMQWQLNWLGCEAGKQINAMVILKDKTERIINTMVKGQDMD